MNIFIEGNMKKNIFTLITFFLSASLFAVQTTTTTTTTTITTVTTDETGVNKTTETTIVKEPGQVESTVVKQNEAVPSKNTSENESVILKSYKSYMEVNHILSQGVDANSLKKIEEKSADLTYEQKSLVLAQNKKEAGTAFILNMLLPAGIGSFVQGDNAGGTTALFGELGSVALFFAGVFVMTSYSSYYYNYNNNWEIGAGLMIAGGAGYFGFKIYELIRPWAYANSYNKKLEESLKISVVLKPYMNLAGNLGPSYGAGLTASF